MSGIDTKRKRRRNGGRGVMTVAAVFFLCAAVLAAVYIAISAYDRKARNRYVEFYDYYAHLDPADIIVVMGGGMLSASRPPVVLGDTIYFPQSFIKDFIDPYIFWEAEAGLLTVTTPSKVYRFEAGSLLYTVNMSEEGVLAEPVVSMNGEAYLPGDAAALIYGLEIGYTTSIAPLPNILTLRQIYDGKPLEYGYISGAETRLRYEPGPKAPIYAELAPGVEVIVFGKDRIVVGKETYVKVQTGSGVIGYVPDSDISGQRVVEGRVKPEAEPSEPFWEGKLVMAWRNVGSAVQPGQEAGWTAEQGLDVVSPTWFTFNKERMDGTIVSLGGRAYTDWAHAAGLKVWGLVSDSSNYDVSNAVLTSAAHRERAVRQLIELAEALNLDGINIDFEMVRQEDIPYFIQFLRELYPMLRERGLFLSVDMYPPAAWNLYYNRTEVAKTCDFVVVMGYDEFWSTSPKAGPNASINFVRNGITDTLREVPPEKLILGVPFYVREWREKPEGENVSVTSRAYSMDRARRIIDERGAALVWDETTACYYAEYTAVEDDIEVLYRVWLEDERSMEEKLRLAAEYGIAGVSGWCKGLESAAVWDLMRLYMKK